MHDQTVDIACLCAAWCRLCDEYAPVLEQVSAELQTAGISLRRHWIDIEDEADLVDDLEVETFPMIVLIDPRSVRFAGPLEPQADTLRRLLRATVADAKLGTRWPAMTPEIEAFAARLRARQQRG